MKTIYDIQQILKKFGTYIYTGNRLGDLDLMNLELDELYRSEFIPLEEYYTARLIIQKEVRRLRKEKG